MHKKKKNSIINNNNNNNHNNNYSNNYNDKHSHDSKHNNEINERWSANTKILRHQKRQNTRFYTCFYDNIIILFLLLVTTPPRRFTYTAAPPPGTRAVSGRHNHGYGPRLKMAGMKYVCFFFFYFFFFVKVSATAFKRSCVATSGCLPIVSASSGDSR